MSTEAAVVATDKPRIIVVDDSRVVRRAINKILSTEFDVVEAEDGESGWQGLLEDDAIQVVVADVEMPRLDGYALICRIRAAETARIQGVPVIVITGAQDEDTRQRAFACGATDFITKPIDGVQMLARARAHAKLDRTTRQLSETSAALEEHTAVDPLTRIHSRRYFMQRGAQDLAYAKRHEQDLSLIRIDIDGFRSLYEQHGDELTDQVLIWIAKILMTTVRTEDTAARIGGSEFALLAPATSRMEAAVLCERLRAAVNAEPFGLGDVTIPTTISMGLATNGRDPSDTIEELLKAADERLTLAKAAGGNRLGASYQEEAPPPDEAVIEEPDMETALQLLGAGEGGKLFPYLPDLLGRILPLLEFCDKNLELELEFDLETLKEKYPATK
jgi:two-component system, cell cycle response regulator